MPNDERLPDDAELLRQAAQMHEALEDDMGKRRLPEPVRDAVYWLNASGRSLVADALALWTESLSGVGGDALSEKIEKEVMPHIPPSTRERVVTGAAHPPHAEPERFDKQTLDDLLDELEATQASYETVGSTSAIKHLDAQRSEVRGKIHVLLSATVEIPFLKVEERDPNHRECQRQDARFAHVIANQGGLLNEALEIIDSVGPSALGDRIRYFREHHRPMRAEGFLDDGRAENKTSYVNSLPSKDKE